MVELKPVWRCSTRTPRCGVRGSKGVDMVKVNSRDLTELHGLGDKLRDCAIRTCEQRQLISLIGVHRPGSGHDGGHCRRKPISRAFPEMDGAAPGAMVRIRGRHCEDLEMVLRIRKDTLDFEHVLEGGAATLYPVLLQLKVAFRVANPSRPSDLSHATGLSIAAAHV